MNRNGIYANGGMIPDLVERCVACYSTDSRLGPNVIYVIVGLKPDLDKNVIYTIVGLIPDLDLNVI